MPMAWLGEDIAAGQAGEARCRIEVIEEALYHHRRSLFGALSVAFFDTTTLYFEGQGGVTLGRRGYSKDFRPQLPQVVLGIVLDENDRPVASFLWPGNTATPAPGLDPEVTTLLPAVERLRSRFGVRRACVVADRGMISVATIAALETQGIDYILGVRGRCAKFARPCSRTTARRCHSSSHARRARPISR
jgi:transposase